LIMTAPADQEPAPRHFLTVATERAPGIALSAAVALAAYFIAPFLAHIIPIPAIVIALIIGVALNPWVATHRIFAPGMVFCVKTLLRGAVALLGIRVSVGEIIALGPTTASLVVLGMVVTLAVAMVFARLNRQSLFYGALAGAGTAVCGASATLATATVLPNYPGKDADIAFVVVTTNSLATLAMVIYPPLCAVFGFDPLETGVMLGGTIHDVAQVVGAGYAVSATVGNTAVIVKLFRVLLLLPTVLGIGWFLTRSGVRHGEARVPVPVFALVFIALCIVNSLILLAPGTVPDYATIKSILVGASNWGLLLAIGALGLGTSISAIAALGWRAIATVVGTTLTILIVVTGGLILLRLV
jgi:uncharacterized integral membrane protein (TIGR00698 family)